MERIEKRSIAVWSISSIQTSIIQLLIVGVIYYFFNSYSFVKTSGHILFVFIILKLLYELVMDPIIYRNTKYQLNEDTLIIRIGGLTVEETTIPLIRIQHVDIEQSFHSRLFNLYSLNIYTAGDYHSISYIKKEVADTLKDKLISVIANKGMKLDE